MGLDFDVLDFCRKLRTSNKPPYTCPVVECGKSYKSMCGLQYHLVNFDHDTAPPTQLSEAPKLQSTPVSATTPTLAVTSGSTPATTLSQPSKKRKKGHGRWSHTPKIKSLKTPLKLLEPLVSPPREGLTYAEAQKLVEFEINGKVIRVSIDQPLRIVSKKEFEAQFENLANQIVTQGSLSLAKSREAVTKLPEPCFKVLDNYNIADAPPMPNSYIRFIERSAEEMDGEVEYDMDEEDAAWLMIINEKRTAVNIPAVPVDTFELLMDRLEKESYFQLKNVVPPPLPLPDH